MRPDESTRNASDGIPLRSMTRVSATPFTVTPLVTRMVSVEHNAMSTNVSQ